MKKSQHLPSKRLLLYLLHTLVLCYSLDTPLYAADHTAEPFLASDNESERADTRIKKDIPTPLNTDYAFTIGGKGLFYYKADQSIDNADNQPVDGWNSILVTATPTESDVVYLYHKDNRNRLYQVVFAQLQPARYKPKHKPPKAREIPLVQGATVQGFVKYIEHHGHNEHLYDSDTLSDDSNTEKVIYHVLIQKAGTTQVKQLHTSGIVDTKQVTLIPFRDTYFFIYKRTLDALIQNKNEFYLQYQVRTTPIQACWLSQDKSAFFYYDINDKLYRIAAPSSGKPLSSSKVKATYTPNTRAPYIVLIYMAGILPISNLRRACKSAI